MSQKIDFTSFNPAERIYALHRLCRPRGKVRISQKDGKTPNHFLSREDLITPGSIGFFTKEEKTCIRWDILANIGRPLQWTQEQDAVRQKVEELKRGIYFSQLNPLKILIAQMKEELIKGISSANRDSSIAVTIKKKVQKFSSIVEKWLVGFCKYESIFKQYFDEGDTKLYKAFQDYLEHSFLKQVYSFSGDKEVSFWVEPLKEKGELLLQCLKDRKNLFPLLLYPCSSLQSPSFFPSKESLALHDTFLKILAFALEKGVEEIEEDFKKINQKILKKIKNPKFKRRCLSLLKSHELMDEIYQLRKLLRAYHHFDGVGKISRLLKNAGTGVFSPKMLKEICELLIEISTEASKVRDQYYKALNALVKLDNSAKKIGSYISTPVSTIGVAYDAWIADPFNGFAIFSEGTFGMYKTHLSSVQKNVKRLESFFSKQRAAFPSCYIQKNDLIIDKMIDKALDLYRRAADKKIKEEVEAILYCLGGIRSRWMRMAKKVYSKLISQGKADSVYIANLLQDLSAIRNDVEALEKVLGSSPEKKEIATELKKYLQELLDVFLSVPKNKQETFLKKLVVERDKESIDLMHMQVLYFLDFYTRKTSRNGRFTKGLLAFFNGKIKTTKQIAQRLDLSRLEMVEEGLNTFTIEQNDVEDFNYIKSTFMTNFHLLKKMRDGFKSIKGISDEKTALSFAKKLMDYQSQMIDFQEVQFFCPDWERLLKKVYTKYLLENLPVRLPKEQLDQFVQNFFEEFVASSRCVNNYFLSHHRPLLRWAREAILSETSKQTTTTKVTTSTTTTSTNPPLIREGETAAIIEEEEVESTSKAQEKVVLSSSARLLDFIKECGAYVKAFPSPCTSLEQDTIAFAKKQQIESSLDLLGKSYLPLIEEQLVSSIKMETPYLYGETLLLHGSLALEQTFKLSIASQTPSKLQECRGSHDLLALATLADVKLSLQEKELLREARNIPGITSRYLWKKHGFVAKCLRELTQGKNVSQNTAAIENMSEALLQVTLRVIKQLHPQLIKQSYLISPNSKPLIHKKDTEYAQVIDQRLILMEQKVHQVEIVHFGSEFRRLCFGKTIGNYAFIRERQILYFLKNAPYYAKGIREVAPYLFSSRDLYSQTNFFMQKVTLFLEQSLLATIAYLDIPSKTNEDSHILTDKIGAKDRERPRYFDHNVQRALTILANFLGEEKLALTDSQKEAAQKLSTFLSQEGRYLTSPTCGALAPEMERLRTLSRLLQKEGFFTEEDRAFLRKRYGSKEEAEWEKKIQEDLKKLQEKTFRPLIIEALQLVDHLLDLNLKLRHST